jgi:transposase
MGIIGPANLTRRITTRVILRAVSSARRRAAGRSPRRSATIHWDGIAAYCTENKVSLGFVEGRNNKIRVFQRRARAAACLAAAALLRRLGHA